MKNKYSQPRHTQNIVNLLSHFLLMQEIKVIGVHQVRQEFKVLLGRKEKEVNLGHKAYQEQMVYLGRKESQGRM